jgi:uncharacterized membrane-anchored protein
MAQLWTIIFITLIALAFGIASWHDREEVRRQEQKKSAQEKAVKDQVSV